MFACGLGEAVRINKNGSFHIRPMRRVIPAAEEFCLTRKLCPRFDPETPRTREHMTPRETCCTRIWKDYIFLVVYCAGDRGLSGMYRVSFSPKAYRVAEWSG